LTQNSGKTKDITLDFLRCNRCGKCRAVCPVLPVFNEEWASARGKVELAEVYFREGKFDERRLYGVFEYCLHCMTCEENCPSGVRANELVMAVRADLARKGRVPWLKRLALKALEGMDGAAFKLARFFRVTREHIYGNVKSLRFDASRKGLHGKESGDQGRGSGKHIKRDGRSARLEALHGVGGKSFLSFLFPLLGWPKQRVVPLPSSKPFLKHAKTLYRAAELEVRLPGGMRLVDVLGMDDPGVILRERFRKLNPLEEESNKSGPPGAVDIGKAVDLALRVARARKTSLEKGVVAYYFVGHAVNHFFPEEAFALVRVLNILGVDVLVPKDQVCCGAPVYFTGDVNGARRLAAKAIDRLTKHDFSFIVTSCASGGHMLKRVYPRLFDLTEDGYFHVEWDEEAGAFRRGEGLAGRSSGSSARAARAAQAYRERIEGNVYDINEIVAEMLELKKREVGLESFLFESSVLEKETVSAGEKKVAVHGRETYESESSTISGQPGDEGINRSDHFHDRSRISPSSTASLPIVTYHHPCHLNRGQDVSWQPEEILRLLPTYRYEVMEDADRCCGGGGAFTFEHAKASDAIAMRKVRAIEALRPDIVATSCPICRTQLTDVITRHLVIEREERGEEPIVPVVTSTTELLYEDLKKILMVKEK